MLTAMAEAKTEELTILVVEDDDDTRFMIEQLLLMSGYKVVTASDGEAGLNVARRRNPDMILTDIAMPGMSGIDLIKLIRLDAAFRDIPILALTAYRYQVEKEVRETGADAVLAKPFQVDSLLNEVKRLIGK